MAKRVQFGDIARESGLDLDEALVRAWDAGLDQIDDADQLLDSSLANRVRRSFGVADAKQLQQIAYWQDQWGLTRRETENRLRNEFGVHVSPQARVLPKGALRRLRSSAGPRASLAQAVAVPAQRAEQMPPLVWETPGHQRDVTAVDVDEICQIHDALVREFESSGDPIQPSGVREPHLLHSATSRPETSLGDTRKYDTVEVYAAALVHSLVHNHAFFNGNKRTALVSMLVLLDRNGILLTCTQDELFKQVLRVAQHGLVPAGASERADREVLSMAHWICRNSRQIQRGERIIKWKDLRKVLAKFDCEIGSPLPGNKIRVERAVLVKGRLGFRRKELIVIKAGYRTDGTDVDANQLNRIRRELRLSEADGIDSEQFYGSDPRELDSFINEYRTLLRRLARL